MKTVRLGWTDLHITPIGFGAWAAGGGDYAFGWGAQDDRESIAAIEHALALGINWIDTAPVYGLGRSEEVVARTLANIPGDRRPYVFTKCGLVWGDDRRIGFSLEADSLRREVEDSLRRLRVDVIDLYQIHWPAFPATAPDKDIEKAWRTLVALKHAGKLRHIGVSNFNASQLARIWHHGRVASLQPPYSMLRRDIEDSTLPWCALHDVGVIVYSPMQSGLLSGAMTRERIAAFPADDWRKTLNPQFQEPRLSLNLELVEGLRVLGARYGKSPAEVAIAWTLAHPAVTGAIVGARRPSQIDGFIGAAEWRLSEEDKEEIDGLLERGRS